MLVDMATLHAEARRAWNAAKAAGKSDEDANRETTEAAASHVLQIASAGARFLTTEQQDRLMAFADRIRTIGCLSCASKGPVTTR